VSRTWPRACAGRGEDTFAHGETEVADTRESHQGTLAHACGGVGEERAAIERRLLDQQSGERFICQDLIDLLLHKGELDIDHVVPLADQGLDDENNFALCHSRRNRSKAAANLMVARRMAEFDKLQTEARKAGARGANLGHVLRRYGGARHQLRLKVDGERVEFVLTSTDDSSIHVAPLHRGDLSGMRCFVAVLPLAFVHHDDRINPRSIGGTFASSSRSS
jgi:hypothetical protein